MKTATKSFYLSVFTLWASPSACAGASETCPISSRAIVDDACASYATLERLNRVVKPAIDDLTRTTDYFSYYRLNLFNKVCPFWDEENGFCANIGCAVETLDNEEDIPLIWRANELSKLEGPRAKHPGKKEQKQHPDRPLHGELGDDVGESCVVEYDDECDDRDYCVPEDESAAAPGDYVSLLKNPERFTGYGGEGAWQVWNAIYQENCFSKASFPHSANLGVSPAAPGGPAAQDFRHVLSAAGRHAQLERKLVNSDAPPVLNPAYEIDDECLEKRVFYRIISGMHASISAHLCWDFLNQTTGEWQPNVACYESRLHQHPDRISNLYFNYAVVTRAIAKLGPYLKDPAYRYCTGDPSEDAATRAKVLNVISRAASVPQIFDESLMFVNGEGPSLKEDFRNRFRNVSRLMDCVGCDKCRLWGKVQTVGYGTALKVLFEFDNAGEDVPPLKRTEIVALFNTYARLGESLSTIQKFRRMVEEQAKEGDDLSLPASDDGIGDEDRREAAEEVEDETLKEFIRLRQRGPKSHSVKDTFDYELERFTMAVKVVINSWIRVPRTFWEIITSETKRLYQFWIGLPVSPRKWKLELPNLDRDDL